MGETLRPNLGGDETALNYYDGATHAPDVLHNFEQVDDVTPDDASTYVYRAVAGAVRDLYNLPAHSASGAITGVEVFFRCLESSGGQFTAKPVIKSDSTITEGTAVVPTANWVTYSQLWTTNPGSTPPGQPWGSDWSVIDNLQIGVKLEGSSKVVMYCTQVYVSVYTSLIKIINETVEIKRVDWISPTGFEDPSSVWTTETNAYDGDINTQAYTSVGGQTWGGFLVLTHSALVSDTLRFYCLVPPEISEVDLDVLYEGDAEYTDAYQGSGFYSDNWVEKMPPRRGSITKARIRFYCNDIPAHSNPVYFKEFYFGLTSTVKRLRSVKLIAETVQVAEGLVKRLRQIKLIAETVSLVETLIKGFRKVKLVAETVTIAEGLVKRFRSVKLVAETVGITEGIIRKLIAIGQPYIARVQRIFGMRTWGGN